MISSFISKWLPTQSTKIDINDDGKNLTATVGNFGMIKSEQLKNETGRTMILQGDGFASEFQMEDETFTLAPSDSQCRPGYATSVHYKVRCSSKVQLEWLVDYFSDRLLLDTPSFSCFLNNLSNIWFYSKFTRNIHGSFSEYGVHCVKAHLLQGIFNALR